MVLQKVFPWILFYFCSFVAPAPVLGYLHIFKKILKMGPGRFHGLTFNVIYNIKSTCLSFDTWAMCVIDSVSVPFTRVINHPQHKSICYHPSLLPRHRGASAINWTLMEGDRKGGFSIFWADDGLDTGPLLLQKECYIGENDTVDSVYNGFMYPVGKFLFLLY